MALRKIALMHRVFGICEGHACRECSNLIHVRANDRPLTKCKVYGETSSEASDWTQRWQACGMFNKPWGGNPIMRLVRPTRTDKKEEQLIPLEGQMTMEVDNNGLENHRQR